MWAVAFQKGDIVGHKSVCGGEAGVRLGELTIEVICEVEKRSKCFGEKFRKSLAAGGSALRKVVC